MNKHQAALEQIQRMLSDTLPKDPKVNPFADAELSAAELQIRWDAQNSSILKIVSDALENDGETK